MNCPNFSFVQTIAEIKRGRKDFKGIVEREIPLHYSNLALVDPEDRMPCRIKFAFQEDGTRVRVSKRSGRIIPYPLKKHDAHDMAHPGM